VLYSMAVIELAKPGQEATTYELIVTVGNAALLVNGVVSTQLLTPFKGVACNDDDNETGCGDSTVDTDSPSAFKDSGGPWRFTQYCLVLQAISVVSVVVFARFLPRSKQMCHDWKEMGEKMGTSDTRGKVTLAIVTITMLVSQYACHVNGCFRTNKQSIRVVCGCSTELWAPFSC
jgi:hypothetical protein